MKNKLIILLLVKQITVFPQKNDTKIPYSIFNLSTCYYYYSIDDINSGDSVVGRNNIYFLNPDFQIKVKGNFFVGCKAQYNYFRYGFFSSLKFNSFHGYMIGPSLGYNYLSKDKNVYANLKFTYLITNFDLLDNLGYSNVINRNNFNLMYGFDLNFGIMIFNKMYLTLGLSLNNVFKRNYEFNYPKIGMAYPMFKAQKSTKSVPSF